MDKLLDWLFYAAGAIVVFVVGAIALRHILKNVDDSSPSMSLMLDVLEIIDVIGIVSVLLYIIWIYFWRISKT